MFLINFSQIKLQANDDQNIGFHMPAATKGFSAKGAGFNLKFWRGGVKVDLLMGFWHYYENTEVKRNAAQDDVLVYR